MSEEKKTVKSLKTGELAGKKRLSFLFSFLRSNFITIKSIPSKVINPGTLITCLSKDDMRLSQAAAIIRHYGYTLKIFLEPKDPVLAKHYRSRCLNVLGGALMEDGGKRMAFLKDFMEVNGMTMKDFAEKIGVTPSNVFHWLQIDDIMINWLYKIAKTFTVNIRFVIEPVNEVLPDYEHSDCAFILDIHAVKPGCIMKDQLMTMFEKKAGVNEIK